MTGQLDYSRRDVIMKLVVVGECAVGKTAISMNYVDGRFVENHKSTIGADLLTKSIEVNGTPVTLQIWDTAGQERYQAFSNAFWRGSNGCILIYDITNEQSFHKIDGWRKKVLNEIQPESVSQFPLLLLGNKCDMSIQKRTVTTDTAKRYALDNHMLFYETSALNGLNVENSIQELCEQALIYNKFDFEQELIMDTVECDDDEDIEDLNQTSVCSCLVF